MILPDVLQPGLWAVFCGTAASNVSARVGAYYAGPGNAFWPTLHSVGLTPHRLDPAAFHTLPDYGLGLTDLAKHESGVDAQLSATAFDVGGLTTRVVTHAPHILAFTSKTAASAYLGRGVAYGWQPERIEQTRVFVLPSPSGAARRYWDIVPWQALAEAVRALGGR